MNSAYFIKVFQRKPYNWKVKSIVVENIIKCRNGSSESYWREVANVRKISKSVQPRCFKHVKSLPCCYCAQPKSWMISFLFDEWVKELDRKFEKESRATVLIVDNCPAHPIVDGLKATELVFLPPNTTSKSQPMDQGVIRSLKPKYHRKIIKRLIRAVDMKKKLPQTSILDAMQLLQSAW